MEHNLKVTFVVKITAVTSEEDTSGGWITNHLQVGDLVIQQARTERFDAKVGDEVEWCEWLEREGVFGHIIVEGLGTIVHIDM